MKHQPEDLYDALATGRGWEHDPARWHVQVNDRRTQELLRRSASYLGLAVETLFLSCALRYMHDHPALEKVREEMREEDKKRGE